jgi:hypothetical protein
MPPEQRKMSPAIELMGAQMEKRVQIRDQWKRTLATSPTRTCSP